MPKFSKRSLDNLSQVHPDLARVARRAILSFDFVVICGQRGREEQEAARRRGMSEAAFGQSPHNYAPALAFDAAPWPKLFGSSLADFDRMAEAIQRAAREEGVAITWGADWDRDGKKRERGEFDSPHFQLADWRVRAARGEARRVDLK